MDSIFCQSNELGRVFEGQLSIDGVAHDLDAEDYFFFLVFFSYPSQARSRFESCALNKFAAYFFIPCNP